MNSCGQNILNPPAFLINLKLFFPVDIEQLWQLASMGFAYFVFTFSQLRLIMVLFNSCVCRVYKNTYALKMFQFFSHYNHKP